MKSASIRVARVVPMLANVLLQPHGEPYSPCVLIIDPKHKWLLLEAGGLALGWSSASLGPRAVLEGHGEACQEQSLAAGLLAWLAWEAEIDITALLQRTTPVDITRGANPWHRVQVFASVAGQLAGDAEARDVLTHAVLRTARKGTDGLDWVARHLDLADRLTAISTSPDSAMSPARAARPGDLVVLGAALDPRLRVVLAVAPSGSSDRVAVYDEADEDGQRQFVTTHVKWIEWWSPATVARRQAPGA